MFLISFEGIDKCGKSTQAKKFEHWLNMTYPKLHPILTKEPGSSEPGELKERTLLRNMLLNPDRDLCDRTELFLFLADRAEHFHSVVLPMLNRGMPVVTDRCLDSTWAYQGFGKRMSLGLIQDGSLFAMQGRMPDLTFVIEISVKEMRKRMEEDAQWDRMEQNDDSFYERCIDGFRTARVMDAGRIVPLDGTQSIEDIAASVENEFVARLAPKIDKADKDDLKRY